MKPSRPEPRCEDSRPSSLVSLPVVGSAGATCGDGGAADDDAGSPRSAIFRTSRNFPEERWPPPP